MDYRLLGRSGVRVSDLCLGTVYFGTQVPVAESIRIIQTALDLGINFIDTAEIYMRPHYGRAEEVVGQALQGRRHEVVLATKKRYDPAPLRSGGPGDHGLSRHQIVTAIEQSLRRLGTDYIDLYYPHHVDPETDPEETLRAFDDLVRAGKVRNIGLSNHPAWKVIEALWLADRRNLAPPICVQTLYNLLDRSAARELAPACARYGLSLVPYSPLAGGVLTNKYGTGSELPADSRAARVGHAAAGRPGHVPVLSTRNLTVAERLSAMAAERGASAGQASIAWLLHQPQVASVIVGASHVGQLTDNLRATDLQLSQADVDAITALADQP